MWLINADNRICVGCIWFCTTFTPDFADPLVSFPHFLIFSYNRKRSPKWVPAKFFVHMLAYSDADTRDAFARILRRWLVPEYDVRGKWDMKHIMLSTSLIFFLIKKGKRCRRHCMLYLISCIDMHFWLEYLIYQGFGKYLSLFRGKKMEINGLGEILIINNDNSSAIFWFY